MTDFCGMELMTKQFMSRLVCDRSRSVSQVDFMASWSKHRQFLMGYPWSYKYLCWHGSVHSTSRMPESCVSAAPYRPKDIKMLYKLDLWKKGRSALAPQGNAAAALVAEVLSLHGPVSYQTWWAAVLSLLQTVKGGQKHTCFLLGFSWE